MIELKVTLRDIKKTNDVVNVLNSMLEKILTTFQWPFKVRAVSNGNHLGYGLVRIADDTTNIENVEEAAQAAYNITKMFQMQAQVKSVEVSLLSDEETEYFIYNYGIISEKEKEGYRLIRKLT